MAGYSGTPLPKKLGIKPSARVYLLRAPQGMTQALHPLPAGVTLLHNLRGKAPADVLLLFARQQSVVAELFAAARERMLPHAGLWVCWPKKSSGLRSDLDDAWVRQFGLDQGLVDNKVCAVDETWSALRFVIRLQDR